MFLIDMKFISKPVCCLVMENVASPVPHLRKIIFKIYIHKTYTKNVNFKKNVGLPFEVFEKTTKK